MDLTPKDLVRRSVAMARSYHRRGDKASAKWAMKVARHIKAAAIRIKSYS